MKKPKKGGAPTDGVKPVATNRKAFHDYFIEDKTEAGLVLTGTEVKSLREGRAQLKDSYVLFRAGDRPVGGRRVDEGRGLRAAVALLQGEAGEGADRAGSRQEAPRQARRDPGPGPAAGSRSRHA